MRACARAFKQDRREPKIEEKEWREKSKRNGGPGAALLEQEIRWETAPQESNLVDVAFLREQKLLKLTSSTSPQQPSNKVLGSSLARVAPARRLAEDHAHLRPHIISPTSPAPQGNKMTAVNTGKRLGRASPDPKPGRRPQADASRHGAPSGRCY